jgi:hypothetical protein
VIARLNTGIVTAVSTSEIRDRPLSQGIEPTPEYTGAVRSGI